MAKFNFKLRRSRHESDSEADLGAHEIVTAEGAPGFIREHRAELFLLGVSNMVGEDTFYEGAADRDARFRELIAAVAVADPEWLPGSCRGCVPVRCCVQRRWWLPWRAPVHRSRRAFRVRGRS